MAKTKLKYRRYARIYAKGYKAGKEFILHQLKDMVDALQP